MHTCNDAVLILLTLCISIYCHANVLGYFHRLLTMRHGSTVKSVFNVLCNLKTKVFRLGSPEHMTWPRCTKLIWIHALIFRHPSLRNFVVNAFINSWVSDLCNGHESYILRTYSLYKTNFGIENYLKYISTPTFRIALSKLRASSHDLEIERGRYVRPKLNFNKRLCMSCHAIEDEEHFVTVCINN